MCIACALHPRRPVAVAELGSLDLMRSTAASLTLVLLLASYVELPLQPPPALVLDGILFMVARRASQNQTLALP